LYFPLFLFNKKFTVGASPAVFSAQISSACNHVVLELYIKL